MHLPVRLDGAARGDQRLSGDLTAEHTLGSGLRALTPEGGRVDLLQIQEIQELVDGGLPLQWQGHTVAGSTSEPSWWTRRVLVEPGAFGGEPATTTT
ncbi:hypothetical protein Acsp01_23260 [Actinoplanes sp. NBRC 101535]|nr:hypothetical protein Acsp01_23260 [Actinoplanes sp. NBRC 101535]